MEGGTGGRNRREEHEGGSGMGWDKEVRLCGGDGNGNGIGIGMACIGFIVRLDIYVCTRRFVPLTTHGELCIGRWWCSYNSIGFLSMEGGLW